MNPLYAIVSSGQRVSGDVDLRQRRLVGIYVPTLGASGTLALQGSFDTTSAGFLRYLETRSPGSGDMQFATGVGSRFVPIPGLDLLPYLRLEIISAVGSLETDNRTFTLLTR